MFKKKKKILTDFGTDFSDERFRSRFQTERENEVLEWQVAGFGSLIRLTGIFWWSEYKIEWHLYRHMHRKWANKSLIQYDSYTLWMIVNIKKRVYITKRGGDESLILDRQQISTGPPPENNFNGFDCYGILGIIQVFTNNL